MLAAGHPPEQVLEQLAATLTNRLLHAPSAALREAAESGDASLADAAARLFAPRPAMKEAIRRRLERVADRHAEIERMLADPAVLGRSDTVPRAVHGIRAHRPGRARP